MLEFSFQKHSGGEDYPPQSGAFRIFLGKLRILRTPEKNYKQKYNFQIVSETDFQYLEGK